MRELPRQGRWSRNASAWRKVFHMAARHAVSAINARSVRIEPYTRNLAWER